MNVLTGYVYGTGASINVSIGCIPDVVELTNVTDGNLITKWNRGKFVGFSSGITEPATGATIQGGTSGATAKVVAVVLSSGAWGSTAAGVVQIDESTATGTFSSGEAITIVGYSGTAMTAAASPLNAEYGVAVAAAATPVTTISSYVGSSPSGNTAGTAKGFTIDSTISTSGKLLRWVALVSDAQA